MMTPPDYFEAVRARADQRWDQLENDPDLAGPWHQLFMQVQSPRHVLSELLQNADDAEARNVSATVDGDDFVFEHDGRDFDESEFTSLCRFGHSNKRSLHTIGFRGVGFKSTFSVGDEVRVLTPTLSVIFKRHRFTEPRWLQHGNPPSTTQIRVRIKDPLRRDQLETSLSEWKRSPLSLLFFRSVQSLVIQGCTAQRQVVGPGPVEGSELVDLSRDQQDDHVLVVRSPLESFPEEALAEMREERMVDEDFKLPPCSVDLVLGIAGHQDIFVVLPTGMQTQLPFTCNAPFLQDPARVKIKDPEISPTNRWLLQRIGRCAAETMLGWLRREDLPLEERARAYRFLPSATASDSHLEAACEAICSAAFDEVVEGTEYLLTEQGQLTSAGGCLTVPAPLYDVWEPKQISSLLDIHHARTLLCRHVSVKHQRRLVQREAVAHFDASGILKMLSSRRPPRPATRGQLLQLWSFVAKALNSDSVGYWPSQNLAKMQIVPVRHGDLLLASRDVTRLGEKRLLPSEDDWDFLSKHLIVLHPQWTRFLSKQRDKAEERQDQELAETVETAEGLLSRLGLGEATAVSQVMGQVTKSFCGKQDRLMEEYVRLTNIAAALSASVPADFPYFTANGNRKSADRIVVADTHRDLDCLVNEPWYDEHVLHDSYSRESESCTKTQWEQWVRSPRSQLRQFIPLEKTPEHIEGRATICQVLQERGVTDEPFFPYVGDRFVIEDWDFEQRHWQHWEHLADGDPTFWARLFARIMEVIDSQGAAGTAAVAMQISQQDTKRKITTEDLVPTWVMKFRGLPCLQDTRGNCCEPAELLRRTPATEALLDVEQFVAGEQDIEKNRPWLIKLGVRDTPGSPDGLLDRLRALTEADNPPILEVIKWYGRLDQLASRCSPEDWQQVNTAFRDEQLILTQSGEWARASEVFLSGNEAEVPGMLTVHELTRELALWLRVGVADRPTAQAVMDWLKNIPSGKKLTADELPRVRSLLPLYAKRIWLECNHWLNLDGEWVATGEFTYKMTMQSLMRWGSLFPAVKQKTADLCVLQAELYQQYPFSELTDLATCVEERIASGLHGLQPQHKPWMEVLGKLLARAIFDDEQETDRVRQLAHRLSKTLWQPTKGLQAEPYIKGTPAGTRRKVDALWADDKLHVEDRTVAGLWSAVTGELDRFFDRLDLKDAIRACFERPADFVTQHIEETFELETPEAVRGPDEHGTVDSAQTTADHEHSEEGDLGELPMESDDDEAHGGPLDLVTIPDDEDDETDPEAPPPLVPRQPHSRQPKLIERYAQIQGYQKDDSINGFRHPDGSRLQKATDGPFQWEKHTAHGELAQSYWVREQCLWEKSVEIHADVWGLCAHSPDQYTLILIDRNGSPIELTGSRLLELQERGKITLYPAEYRIVYEGEPE